MRKIKKVYNQLDDIIIQVSYDRKKLSSKL